MSPSFDWQLCLIKLEEAFSNVDYNASIKYLTYRTHGKELTLTAPNHHIYKKIRSELFERIKKTIKSVYPEFSVMLTPEPDLFEEILTKDEIPALSRSHPTSRPTKASFLLKTTSLIPDQNFDSFIIGRSNELACGVAKQVAEAMATKSSIQGNNPLLFYGPSGLGKTHLLHAIANHVKKKRGDIKVALFTAEQFYRQLVNLLINRSKGNLVEEFKDAMRSLDLLLIDDIQHLEGKKASQDELFFTYNELIGQNKQMIFTSDKYPRDIKDLEERLQSRFTSGLTAMIEPPDFETRVAILQKKATTIHKRFLPDDCAEMIADKLHLSVRELEGALTTLFTYTSLRGKGIDIDSTQEALRDVFGQKDRKISIDNIQKVVAQYYGVPVGEIIGKSRHKSIMLPRQMAMYLVKKLTKHSLKEIGYAFGKRDHTTVINSVKKVEFSLAEQKASFEVDYKNITRQLMI